MSDRDFRVLTENEIYWFYVGELHLQSFCLMCELNISCEVTNIFWIHILLKQVFLYAWYNGGRSLDVDERLNVLFRLFAKGDVFSFPGLDDHVNTYFVYFTYKVDINHISFFNCLLVISLCTFRLKHWCWTFILCC